MYTELACGHCDSSLQVESEEEDAVWLLIHRFANAHADCGFMTPLADSDESPARKVIKPRLTGDAEET